MFRELLSPPEAARLLNVPEATVRRWLRQGLLRFPDGARGIARVDLVRWAREHGIAVSVERVPPPKPAADLLADALERGAVTYGDPQTAADAIELAIAGLPGLDAAQRERLLGEVLERERMASTGLGLGVALPHPRRPPADLFREPVVSACFPERPLDWAALDGEPVSAVLLVLSPSAPVHLELLARIAIVLRSPEFRELLRTHPSREDLVDCLRSIRRTP